MRDAPGETWCAIDLALSRGTRGLPGRSSLAQLLAASGLKNNLKRQPRLKLAEILKWADAYFRRNGAWPAAKSGRVSEAPLETWFGIDRALRFGRRGMAGGSSLPAFLNNHRGLFRGKSRRPRTIRESGRLHIEKIVTWGRTHRRKTGAWPNRASGPVVGTRGLTWSAIDAALKRGNRGLTGGSSLAKLVAQKRQGERPE